MTIKSARIAAALGYSLLAAGTIAAQTAEPQPASQSKSRWEVIAPSGTLVPTGAQKSAIKKGNLSGLQLNFHALPSLAITSMVGWARSRDVAIGGDPKLDVFTYDVGAEFRAPQLNVRKGATFGAFAGAGAGGRSYNHRKLDIDATHNAAAYGSIGGELGIRRVKVRLEARDYVTGFKPLAGSGASRTGNDVVVMLGVGTNRR
jgi:hypothetical protein